MSEEINYMDFEEFRQLGYLQEVNRMVLHPLGVAIEVVTDESGKAIGFGRIWDYRGDDEGMRYGSVDAEKTNRIAQLWRERAVLREDALGYVIQPPDDLAESDLEEECN